MFNEAFASSIPLQGTEIAARWDGLYSFLVWLSVFFFHSCGRRYALFYRSLPSST